VGWVRGADPSDEERQTQFNKPAHLTDFCFILPTMQSESSETPTLLLPPSVSMPNPGELAVAELANEERKDETIKELIKSIERMNRRMNSLEETIATLEKTLQQKSSDALTGTINDNRANCLDRLITELKGPLGQSGPIVIEFTPSLTPGQLRHLFDMYAMNLFAAETHKVRDYKIVATTAAANGYICFDDNIIKTLQLYRPRVIVLDLEPLMPRRPPPPPPPQQQQQQQQGEQLDLEGQGRIMRGGRQVVRRAGNAMLTAGRWMAPYDRRDTLIQSVTLAVAVAGLFTPTTIAQHR